MSTMSPLYPVILCGGDGVRLWPASRKALPKQFMPLNGTTLFKQTLSRAFKLSSSEKSLVICNVNHRFLAASQILEVMVEHGLDSNDKSLMPTIILEPCGKNTAPAITTASIFFGNDDALLLVMSSDHSIGSDDAFLKTVGIGKEVARKDTIVTFGVKPTHPETGYGYIQVGEKGFCQEGEYFQVQKFTEKPNMELAVQFADSEEFFWNSGIFLFKSSVMLKELEKQIPDVLVSCREALEKRTTDLDFVRLDKVSFSSCPAISIDYAVMENASKVAVVELSTHWSDLGSWNSLYDIEKHDNAGNSLVGDVILEESTNTYVMAQSRLVTGIGLHDMVVVETSDAIMVAPKERSQEVKKIVELLTIRSRSEADLHRKVYRPWGSYEQLVLDNRFQVKRLIVFPKQKLSLQKHYHRAEHWVVVGGSALVIVENREIFLGEGQSTYIPMGGTHRLENPGKIPLEIIEIQTGTYLGEDDIVRLEDTYEY